MPGMTATATKAKRTPPPRAAREPAKRMTLAEVMSALEKEGSAQTRKTYARHGAPEPMFGVSFAVLKVLSKRIGVDHELALALWDTDNFDARNLAVKIVDPGRMSPADLDRWARAPGARMCDSYVAHVAAEGPHARARADAWLVSKDAQARRVGWSLVGAMAMGDTETPDAWFVERLSEIEATVRSAPNAQRESMLWALITIGCRSPGFRRSATAAAKRIGKVEVDQGDTACKTPDPVAYIEKTWAHSTAKGFETPAAHERSRESMRTRC